MLNPLAFNSARVESAIGERGQEMAGGNHQESLTGAKAPRWSRDGVIVRPVELADDGSMPDGDSGRQVDREDASRRRTLVHVRTDDDRCSIETPVAGEGPSRRTGARIYCA